MARKGPVYRRKDSPYWWGWYYDSKGQRIPFSTKCTDRKAALDAVKLKEREAHAAGGAATNTASHKVGEALAYLVEVGASDVAPATLQMYAKKGGHLLRLIGPLDVNELHVDDVQGYINERQREGAANETIKKELVTLRRALKLAKQRGLLHRESAACFPEFRAKYVPRDRFLTRDALSLLLARLAPERQLWVLVAVYLGARASEVEAIRWDEHVDLDRGWVLIPGTKTAKSRRRVPIAAPLHAVLERHREAVGPVVAHWGNVRRDLHKACKAVGIEPVSPNDLRRTFASWLKQQGVDSLAVGKMMGHSSGRMVELVYGHLDDRTYKSAIEKMPELPDIGERSRDVTERRLPMRLESRLILPGTPEDGEIAGYLVPRAGIEPATRGFSVPCSTD